MRISRHAFLAYGVLAASVAWTTLVRAQGGDAILAASLVTEPAAASAAGITALAVAGPESNYATAYTFTTLAGIATLAGTVNGTGTAAAFNSPAGVAVDGSGNVYVADTGNSVIRKITSAGVVTTFAGNIAGPGSKNGTGTAAEFNLPYGVAVDASGNVYVADSGNSMIRKITSAGVVTTLAGTAGLSGATNGTGTAARFNFPQGVAVDASGNVYVADSDNSVIRKITAGGVVTTLAGTAGLAGATNATGVAARFNVPQDVAVDASGTLYVADTGNNTIREVTPAGVVTTLAGTAGLTGFTDGTGAAAQFNSPQGVAVDVDGNVYVGDTFNDVIRKIAVGGVVTTLAGTVGVTGSLDGKGPAALFDGPAGVVVDGNGTVYVADSENDTIRRGSLQILSIGVGTAPAITTQPKSVTVVLGAGFSFSVVATGSATLTYQWLLNGAAISGATSATYSVSSSVSAEAGSYAVVVSNTAGSVTSSAATLTFGTPPPPAPDHAGGGAPSLWFDGALALLAGARLAFRRRAGFRAAG